MSDRMNALAQRVADDPFFLSSALAAFARAEGLSDETLAQRLGCAPARLAAIRLCRMPRADRSLFQSDVDRIATAFAIDGGVIAEAVRRFEALHALGAFEQDAGFLMAARDRTADDSDDAPDGEDQR